MNRRAGLSLAALLALGALAGNPGAVTAAVVPAEPLTVLTLRGTHYEAGLAHGRALRGPIHELVGLWKRDLAERFGTSSDSAVAALALRSDFVPAIRTWCPGLLEEVRGISDGAQVPFETMLAYQFPDEAWVMSGGGSGEKCTTIALGRSEDHPSCIAQNLDIPRFYHGHQLLLRFRATDSGIDQDVISFPGYLGACGLNAASVGVGANALPELRYTANGLPVAFVVRSLLERRSRTEALAFLRAIRHAAPQNYVLGDPGGVGSFECSDTSVAEFRPYPDADVTYHANRPLANANYSNAATAMLAALGTDRKGYAASCPRLQFLRRTFGDPARRWNAAHLEAVLRDRASGVNNATTFASLVMVLGERPELRVAAGRPDETPFRTFRFERR